MDTLSSELKQQLHEIFVNDPVAKKLEANLREWGSGQATVELIINKDHTNFLGSGHGGVLFTLGDIAFSYACNSYGRKSLAIHVSLDYHRGVHQGDTIVATVTEINRSRRLANHRIEIHHGTHLVASGSALAFRTDDWHLEKESWPQAWQENH
ncbi:MAG TPA: hotdog fold thioesterase [Acidimicrobiia bacterium]|jgi:acyl-CoA thioesterase|nr:hotdog fold thioesterase [Acidimicrobiia bacterium]HIL46623.1 hotdog fold thioesterase [Acidimicrobiia bacterium]